MNVINNFLTGSVIARIIASIFLFVSLSNHPIGYYKFLRWVVCATALYTIFISYPQKAQLHFGTWLFSLILILFNPIIPLYMGKGNWQIADLVVAIVFIVSIFFLKEKRIN